MSESISVVIITGDQLRHHYFANRLGEHFNLRGIVSESVYKPPIEGSSQDMQDLRKHFAEREEAEGRFFGSDAEFNMPGEDVLEISKGEANSEEVFKWIQSRDPDYLILYGSSIIRDPLLTEFDGRTINMHLGLSPYYRGSGTNFWPLVNREPELVGVTIHLATLQVDAGAILKQVRPDIQPGDRNHDIGCRAVIAGTQTMIESIHGYDRGQIAPQPQPEGGRLYRRSDFNVEAVRKMWGNLEAGMVAEYLSEPERAERHPIID